MPPTLREFISARRLEIKAQICALKDELAQLEKAGNAIADPAAGKGRSSAEGEASSGAGGTIKSYISGILDEAPSGLISPEMPPLIMAKYGANIVRSSLSPQLSRLKHEGAVIAIGRRWFSKKHAPYGIQAEEKPASEPEYPGEDVTDQYTVGDWGEI